MSLASGTRLGPYEIVAPVGAGGMGEVYRARDTRLDRTVAIKILPAEFAGDAKFRMRFDREAKTISALNHPHICSLYDVGDSYLVMEYCEGKTLGKRIADGPLPVAQVLDHGIQIADALDKAHRAGIIHRDLKPANIIVTKSGVKLLDFGLAKHHGGSDPGRSTVQKVTEEGQIAGTVQYMAPELFHGREADARSDIFALGLILYEMATGKPAFSGGSKASLIAAILEHEPKPLSELEPAAPPTLDWLIRACLAKDPDERIQTAHDVLLELRRMSEEISRPSAEHRLRRRSGARWLLPVAIAAAIGGAGALLLIQNRPNREPFRAQRFELHPPEGVRAWMAGGPSLLAISPDGEWVAFWGFSEDPKRSGIYLRSTKELTPRLVVAGRVCCPFFSPDGKWLGFAGEGYLQKIPVAGGEPRRICAVPAAAVRGASWDEDGSIVFATMKGLLSVSADGGVPEVLTEPAAGERHRWPHVLPGGRAVLFVVHRGFSDSWRDVAVMSLDDRKVRVLAKGTSPKYAGGQLIYSHLGILHSAPLDVKRLELTGTVRPVLEDVYFYQGSAYTAFDVSASGSLVYAPGAPRPRETELVWVDRDGNVVPAVEEKRNYYAASLSPDGRRFAVGITGTLEDSDLWIYDNESRRWTRLTFGKRTLDEPPVWSADGEWIVFTSFESGHGRLFRIRADGSSLPEPLTSGGSEWEYAGGISPDGVIAFMRQTADAGWNILTAPLFGAREEQTFLATPDLEAWPAFSPDGRWIAYESLETGPRAIHVRPYPGPGPRVTISKDWGVRPMWSRDGRHISYVRDKEIWSAPVTAGRSFSAGPPKLLFRADFLCRGGCNRSMSLPTVAFSSSAILRKTNRTAISFMPRNGSRK